MDTSTTPIQAQHPAMVADMVDYYRVAQRPLTEGEQLLWQIAWLSGHQAALEDQRREILAQIAAAQGGGL